MGWSNGSYLAELIWDKIKNRIPDEDKVYIAKIIYEEFCSYDADDWSNDKDSLKDVADSYIKI